MLQVLLCLLLLWQAAQGFIITVDAHETVCFYDRAVEHDKITITFEVMEGGFKDIGVEITAPNDDKLFHTEAESNGRYTFSASKHGLYTLCFDNERSTLTPKVLMFQFMVLKDLGYYQDADKRTDDVLEQSALQEQINALSSQMMGIKHEQEYMHVRYSGHEHLSASVHFRIVSWSVFGPSLLLAMALLEIYYLKRFFEVKRVV
ncbi:CG9308 [Drosophila busckii]|uniref:CG9308 n=1 Tax=Drosophila busckii TaxID=30019 RepID=A0A0M4E4W6_DROBS|nr:transmembrane emp24 domain-containing protein 2 [Drosophila busckii]ALC41191.1 CG9308 [Drosophila busckii]